MIIYKDNLRERLYYIVESLVSGEGNIQNRFQNLLHSDSFSIFMVGYDTPHPKLSKDIKNNFETIRQKLTNTGREKIQDVVNRLTDDEARILAKDFLSLYTKLTKLK